MSLDLSSDQLAFHLRLPHGSWDLHALNHPGMGIEGAMMGAQWIRKNRNIAWRGQMKDATITDAKRVNSSLGESVQASVRWSVPRSGLDFNLDCALLLSAPLCLWRLKIGNVSPEPVYLENVEMMCVGRGRKGKTKPFSGWMLPMGPADREESFGAIRLHTSPGDLAFFANGWQSWGYTGALGPKDRYPRTRLGPLTKPMRINPGTLRPRARGHFASDMFAALGDRKWRRGFVAGFLSQQQAFGSLEADLDGLEPRFHMWANTDGIRLDEGDFFTTDWACLQPFDTDEQDPLGPYLDAVAVENQARSTGAIPVGWCSWYQFFDSVTQEDVRENLDWATKHRSHAPLNLIQLDDGFQEQVGDWLSFKETFPDGVTAIASKAKEAGFQPGIWLAPLIVRPNAKIIKEHPHWLLRSKTGQPVHAGFIWDSFTRALDVTHPQVLDHVRRIIRTSVNEWGFEYLKLDFLYAGALRGVRHDPKVTRAQALYRALSEMRETAGTDVTMLGCGCPLGSGIGIFDAMRIGPDVAPNWLPAYKGIEFPFKAEPDFPSVRNAIRNIITRAPMHRRWWVNDPDCLLIRSTDTRLSEAEVQSLATVISLSGGSMIISDDLPSLDRQRIEWLAKLLPPLPQHARAIDWFDAAYPSRLLLPISDETGARFLVAFLNWLDRPRIMDSILDEFPLPRVGTYHAVDFWNASYQRIEAGIDSSTQIPAHGVRFLALRPVQKAPAWIGDTLHVSQGMAVRRWRAEPKSVRAQLDLERQAEGRIWIALPAPPHEVMLNGSEQDWREAGQGVYDFDVSFEGAAKLEISWG
jgi:alpha-galactosidase